MSPEMSQIIPKSYQSYLKLMYDAILIVHEITPKFWNMVENLVTRSVIHQNFGNFMQNTNFDVTISDSVMFGLHFIHSNMVSDLSLKKCITFHGQTTSSIEAKSV